MIGRRRHRQFLQPEKTADVHQHLIKLDQSLGSGRKFLSVTFFVSFPGEILAGGEAEESDANGVGYPDAESRNSVGDFDIDVESGLLVTPEFTKESHDETL